MMGPTCALLSPVLDISTLGLDDGTGHTLIPGDLVSVLQIVLHHLLSFGLVSQPRNNPETHKVPAIGPLNNQHPRQQKLVQSDEFFSVDFHYASRHDPSPGSLN